jgi:SAM-dependent methyltransferase
LSHPERIVPDETEPGIVALHLKRYEFALPYCVGKHVLDAGCGVGYGSAFLGAAARSVVGVDVSGEAIDYARARYGGGNVEFAVGDLQQLERTDAEFDAVVAFEVIEHLPQPERFVVEVRRVLKPDGVLVVSTPRSEQGSSARPENPFHEREFTSAEFEHLLRGSFGSVDVYGQRRVRTARHRALQRLDVLGLRRRLPLVRRASRLVTGTAPMDAVSSEGVVISPDGVDEATELVAVCRA